MIEGMLLSAIIADSNLITSRGEAPVQMYNCPQGGVFISSNFSSNLTYWKKCMTSSVRQREPWSDFPDTHLSSSRFSTAYIPLSLDRDCFLITVFLVLSSLQKPIPGWRRINSWQRERCVIWVHQSFSSSIQLFHITNEWMMLHSGTLCTSRCGVLCTDFKVIKHCALCWYSIG